MKYLITDYELLDYISGAMSPEDRMKLEEKALRTGQSDLLLHAELADYAATENCYFDGINEDVSVSDIPSFKAASIKKPEK